MALNGILKKPNATLAKAEKAEQCLPLHYEVSVNGGVLGFTSVILALRGLTQNDC